MLEWIIKGIKKRCPVLFQPLEFKNSPPTKARMLFMVKYELPARIVLSLFTVIPLFFAYSTLQSSQPLLFISMLLASVLFLVTQLNIKQFLMPKRQPNAKLLNMQKALGTASVVLLMLNIAFKDIMLF